MTEQESIDIQAESSASQSCLAHGESLNLEAGYTVNDDDASDFLWGEKPRVCEDIVADLEKLEEQPDLGDVKRLLQELSIQAEDLSPLDQRLHREAAVRALGGKVSSPASLVDIALQVHRTNTENEQRPSLTSGPSEYRYRETERGLVLLKPTKEGTAEVLLTNFAARIVGEAIHDDGVETRRSFQIEASHRQRLSSFNVSASRFPGLSWVTEKLGPSAVVSAGSSIRDHTRAAIQLLSPDVPSRTVYAHLGWRRIDGQPCYIHSGGSIGPIGPISRVDVELPEALARYKLPNPATGEDRLIAVEASLDLLNILPDRVILPLYCSIWRAVLGPSDFALHLSGTTGEGKTEAAALIQQHSGAEMDARHLPGSWSSTSNANEILAFSAKDGLFVVDDFAPEGTAYDVQRQHKEAARLLRAQGNRAGRQRLRPDASLRPEKAPRGLILSTGEDTPKAHSIRARMLTLEVPAGTMDWQKLTLCQARANSGLYSLALSSFVQWLAQRYDSLQLLKPTRINSLRQEATASSGPHRRTPSIIAELAFGLELFALFAEESGALSQTEANALWRRCWLALGQAAGSQAHILRVADPVKRFLELLRSAIVAGNAHLATPSGTEPQNPEAFGWRVRRFGNTDYVQDEWLPQGQRAGWVDGDLIYLDPDTAYKAATQMAIGEGLNLQPKTLWKRLRDRRILVLFGHQHNTTRRVLQGSRHRVLALKTEALIPQESGQSGQSSHLNTSTGNQRDISPVVSQDLTDSEESKVPERLRHLAADPLEV